MAIYRLEAKIIGRATGRSAVGAAAYRSGEKVTAKPGRSILSAVAYRSGERLTDEGRGIAFDYSRKQHVEHETIIAPEGAPDWVYDRQKLWNAVEEREDRSQRPWHAQLARELLLTLPRELNQAQSVELVERFIDRACVAKGMVADIAIHCPDASDGGEQPHAHVLLTLRRLEDGAFTAKARDWNRLVTVWRPAWEEAVNDALGEAGFDERVDHRSLEERGLDYEPSVKIGVSKFAEGKLHAERRSAHERVAHENMMRAMTRPFDPEDPIMVGALAEWQRSFDHDHAPEIEPLRPRPPDIGSDAEPRRKRRAPELGQGIDR